MTATPSNIIITYPVSGSDTPARVTISTTSVTENWTKKVTMITPPKSKSGQGLSEGKNHTLVVDILREAEFRVTVTGYIDQEYESGIISPEKTNVTDRKNDLYNIFFSGKMFNITYEGQTLSCNSDKIEVKYMPKDEATISQYEVTFTVVIGDGYGES